LPVSVVISLVAYLSSKIKNLEIELAKKLNIPILSYPHALAEIFNQSFGIFTQTHFLFHQFIKVFKEIKKDKKTNLIIFKTFPSSREKNYFENKKIKNRY
jgi:glycerol uptake facilitator-like aquaporin